MKEWKKGRVRLAAWGGGASHVAEVLPLLRLTVMWPVFWLNVWSVTVGITWLGWSYSAAVEVRHG